MQVHAGGAYEEPHMKARSTKHMEGCGIHGMYGMCGSARVVVHSACWFIGAMKRWFIGAAILL